MGIDAVAGFPAPRTQSYGLHVHTTERRKGRQSIDGMKEELILSDQAFNSTTGRVIFTHWRRLSPPVGLSVDEEEVVTETSLGEEQDQVSSWNRSICPA
jgi:hypothetical protein